VTRHLDALFADESLRDAQRKEAHDLAELGGRPLGVLSHECLREVLRGLSLLFGTDPAAE
jgi:hypothetical protein